MWINFTVNLVFYSLSSSLHRTHSTNSMSVLNTRTVRYCTLSTQLTLARLVTCPHIPSGTSSLSSPALRIASYNSTVGELLGYDARSERGVYWNNIQRHYLLECWRSRSSSSSRLQCISSKYQIWWFSTVVTFVMCLLCRELHEDRPCIPHTIKLTKCRF